MQEGCPLCTSFVLLPSAGSTARGRVDAAVQSGAMAEQIQASRVLLEWPHSDFTARGSKVISFTTGSRSRRDNAQHIK